MKLGTLPLAWAMGLLCAAPAFAADAGIAGDAKAFGTRASADSVDISPDGKHLLMIDPGPGRTSILSIVDVATGAVRPILKSDADPEGLYWCKFATNSQLICKYGGGAY